MRGDGEDIVGFPGGAAGADIGMDDLEGEHVRVTRRLLVFNHHGCSVSGK